MRPSQVNVSAINFDHVTRLLYVPIKQAFIAKSKRKKHTVREPGKIEVVNHFSVITFHLTNARVNAAVVQRSTRIPSYNEYKDSFILFLTDPHQVLGVFIEHPTVSKQQ